VLLIGNLEQPVYPISLTGDQRHVRERVLASLLKQRLRWVELYFQDGRLMCVGPVRANATLGDRLVQKSRYYFLTLITGCAGSDGCRFEPGEDTCKL